VFGVVPLVAATPTLSKATTRRSAASASTSARIPVVEIAAEVLQQDERHPAYTEVAIGVVDRVAGSDSSARSVGVSHSCFGPCPFFGDGHWPVPSCTRVSRQRRP